MRLLRLSAVLGTAAVAVAATASHAPDPSLTRMLRAPSVSAQHIAFAYAQNVWVVDRKGRSEEHTSELPVT